MHSFKKYIFENINNPIKKYLGYKIVGWTGKKAFSIYNLNHEISLKKGQITTNPEGVYLGNSKQYVIDYFSGGTNYQDLLLTYEYDSKDLIKGDPEFLNGEVKVKSVKLIDIEKID